jgi:cell division septal protein FtsQ
VRIRLLEDDRGHQARPARRKRGKARRSQTFQAALPMPQAPARRVVPRRARALPLPGAAQKERAPRSRPAGSRAKATTAQPVQARATGWASRFGLRFGALLLLGLLVAAVVHASTDARFFVYQAGVIGAKHLRAEGIYEAAGIHEQNIFWIDPAAIVERIARLDGVKAAHVRCELPAKVTIRVEERQPRVMWRTVSQERDWWLDEEGVVLPYHGDAQAPGTLFVVDSSVQELDFGQMIEPEGVVASVLQLAAALPQSIFFYNADRGLSFTQEGKHGHWPVYVGSSEDLERKIQVMQALTVYLEANDITPRYVDVRWATHPVYGRPLGEMREGGE